METTTDDFDQSRMKARLNYMATRERLKAARRKDPAGFSLFLKKIQAPPAELRESIRTAQDEILRTLSALASTAMIEIVLATMDEREAEWVDMGFDRGDLAREVDAFGLAEPAEADGEVPERPTPRDWFQDAIDIGIAKGMAFPEMPTAADPEHVVHNFTLLEQNRSAMIATYNDGNLASFARTVIRDIWINLTSLAMAGIDARPIWAAMVERAMAEPAEVYSLDRLPILRMLYEQKPIVPPRPTGPESDPVDPTGDEADPASIDA